MVPTALATRAWMVVGVETTCPSAILPLLTAGLGGRQVMELFAIPDPMTLRGDCVLGPAVPVLGKQLSLDTDMRNTTTHHNNVLTRKFCDDQRGH